MLKELLEEKLHSKQFSLPFRSLRRRNENIRFINFVLENSEIRKRLLRVRELMRDRLKEEGVGDLLSVFGF